MKERLGLTELRKKHNRMDFGSIQGDAYLDDLGVSGSARFGLGGGSSTMGRLGEGSSSNSGAIRAPVADAKTKARVSKTLAAKLHKQNQLLNQQVHVHSFGGGTTTVRRHVAGTASSVAFTPLQVSIFLTRHNPLVRWEIIKSS